MTKRMDWSKIEMNQKIRKNGREDVDGRIIVPGQGEASSLSLASGRDSFQLISEFIEQLAVADVLCRAPPAVPPEVMQQLGFSGAERTALRFLRRLGQYKLAFQKAADQAASGL